MTKKFSISISDWVYNQYLNGIRSNRSKFIEEMLVKGVTADMGELEGIRSRQIEILKELKNKEEEIRKLSLLVGSLKKKLGSEEDEELKEREKALTGMKNAGMFRGDDE